MRRLGVIIILNGNQMLDHGTSGQRSAPGGSDQRKAELFISLKNEIVRQRNSYLPGGGSCWNEQRTRGDKVINTVSGGRDVRERIINHGIYLRGVRKLNRNR